MPQPPYYYRSADAPVLDLSTFGEKLSETETSRQAAFDLSRKIHIQLVKARADLELPTTTTEPQNPKTPKPQNPYILNIY